MSLFNQVSDGIIAAMKARDKEKLEALRNLKKVMLEARSNKGAGSELTDDESLKLIRKLIKQGRQSAEIYKSQNRNDLFEHEMTQVKILEIFLPDTTQGVDMNLNVNQEKIISNATRSVSLEEFEKIIKISLRDSDKSVNFLFDPKNTDYQV